MAANAQLQEHNGRNDDDGELPCSTYSGVLRLIFPVIHLSGSRVSSSHSESADTAAHQSDDSKCRPYISYHTSSQAVTCPGAPRRRSSDTFAAACVRLAPVLYNPALDNPAAVASAIHDRDSDLGRMLREVIAAGVGLELAGVQFTLQQAAMQAVDAQTFDLFNLQHLTKEVIANLAREDPHIAIALNLEGQVTRLAAMVAGVDRALPLLRRDIQSLATVESVSQIQHDLQALTTQFSQFAQSSGQMPGQVTQIHANTTALPAAMRWVMGIFARQRPEGYPDAPPV